MRQSFCRNGAKVKLNAHGRPVGPEGCSPITLSSFRLPFMGQIAASLFLLSIRSSHRIAFPAEQEMLCVLSLLADNLFPKGRTSALQASNSLKTAAGTYPAIPQDGSSAQCPVIVRKACAASFQDERVSEKSQWGASPTDLLCVVPPPTGDARRCRMSNPASEAWRAFAFSHDS